MARARPLASIALACLLGGLGPGLGCRAERPGEPGAAPASAGTSATPAEPTTAAGPAPARRSAFPPPEVDLPADRLHERVDGAEPLLQSQGCVRLRFWRLGEPPADLELLTFRSPAGAHQALERDAGPDRTTRLPGDEAWTNGQVLYLRHGASYLRLIADRTEPEARLVEVSKRVEAALSAGEL